MTRRMGAEAGQDLVEYALILPLFLLLSLSVFEFGILFFQFNTVSNAAREAARAGIIPATSTCGEACIDDRVEAAARRLTTGLNQDDLDVQVLHPDGSTVRVVISYQTELISSIVVDAVGGSGDLTLSASATMQREN
jgi:hypothetical protein